MEIYRCRKCRQDLQIENSVIEDIAGCSVVKTGLSSILYLDVDTCPGWVIESFQQASWTKGKLLCVKCRGRLGSFDFVNKKVCLCRHHSTPVVHIVRDRIDQVQRKHNVPGVISAVKRTFISGGPTCIVDNVGTTVVSTSNSGERINNNDNERDKISSSTKWGHSQMQNRHTYKNSYSHINSLHDLGETSVEHSQSGSDNLHEAFGISYNKFNVLPVEEAEPDTKEGLETKESEKKVEEEIWDTDLTCAICLEMYYRPHRCDPCNHIFCEHCLRQVSIQKPTLTPCPLCRNVIHKCVLQYDLTEHIKTHYEEYYKERGHETRRKRRNMYPLPSCTPGQHARYLQGHRGQVRREQHSVVRGCVQKILVRLACLFPLLVIHNILLGLDYLLMFDVYSPMAMNFNYFLLTLIGKLGILGVIYCLKKCFSISTTQHSICQAVLCVFIFYVLWDSNSLILFVLNIFVLGSLFL